VKKSDSDGDWVSKASERVRRCHTCKDPAGPLVGSLLKAIDAAGKSGKVSLEKIHARIEEKSPGFKSRVSLYALRNHVDAHEPLWAKSRSHS
jgi:hypothetical protein